jgi:type II secretory pathway predicted ATPase ExeA
MYESYWRLARRPFGGGCDARAYYPGEAHQGSLLKLRYAIESRCGAALLVGAPGTGKTLVVRLLAERLCDEFLPRVHLTFPQMTVAELAAYLAVELGADGVASGPAPSLDRTIRAIEGRLAENAAAGKHAVVIIDEAHLLDATRTFEALRLLLNYEHDGRPALTIVFVGQTSLLPTLARIPALEQRLAVKCLLRRLSRDETHAYVQHRLREADGPSDLFEPDALDALHAITHGVPRDINRLGDLALLLGYSDEASSIDAGIVEAVARELVEIVVD